MPRVSGGLTSHRRHKKLLKLARGYRGTRSKQFKVANQAVMKALDYAYIGRKKRKRDFRRLWITRINAAARTNGLSYSKLICGLRLAGITLDRKVLAELAVHDMAAFKQIADMAKAKINA